MGEATSGSLRTQHARRVSPCRFRHFIDGAFVDSIDGDTFESRNPRDGTLIGLAARASRADVDAAVGAARRALEGPWGAMPVARRVELLHAVADEITRRFDDFVAAEVADTGKPVTVASNLDVPRGAADFKIFADLVQNVPTETFEMTTPDGGQALNYAVRMPRGVIGVIALGGSGRSGIGRDGGAHSLEFYTELRNVCIKYDTAAGEAA